MMYGCAMERGFSGGWGWEGGERGKLVFVGLVFGNWGRGMEGREGRWR